MNDTTLFSPERLTSTDLGHLWHPDLPDVGTWPEVTEKLISLGFEVCIVIGDPTHFTESAIECRDGGKEYRDLLKSWVPTPSPEFSPEGWILVAKVDSEDGPLACFVRPVEVRAER